MGKPHIARRPLRHRYRPFDAMRALRILLRDPEDTAQVFRIIDALGGPAFDALYTRFRRQPDALSILEREKSLCDALSDRAYLAALPEGSLGRDYLAFVEREQLSAEGLVAASESAEADAPAQADEDPLQRRFGDRLRDSHDLYHVVGQFGRDGMGEVCVLAFTHANSGNPGILLVILGGLQKYRREAPGFPILRMVWQAWQMGRDACSLAGADWEALLPLPTTEVRRLLGIGTPTIYLSSGVARWEAQRAATA